LSSSRVRRPLICADCSSTTAAWIRKHLFFLKAVAALLVPFENCLVFRAAGDLSARTVLE
jgi:hypothetical protein